MTVRVTTTIGAGPANNGDLVALADLKTDLGIASGDTSDDVFLARAITRASAAIAQYCNRVLPKQTLTDTFDLTFARLQARGEPSLQASDWPVITITSLTENGTALVKDSDYRVDTAAGLLYRLDGNGQDASWCTTPVVLTYDAGYAAVPLDVQGAVSAVVSSLKFNKTRDPLLRSENILSGLYAYTLFDPTQVPAGTAEQVAGTLDNYRIPVFT